jgi:hypothetical protein
MWIGKRSETKQTFPGMFDNLVRKKFGKKFTFNYKFVIFFKYAGGLSHNLTPTECMVKECGEEAQIPEELVADKLKAVGAIRYKSEKIHLIHRDIISIVMNDIRKSEKVTL